MPLFCKFLIAFSAGLYSLTCPAQEPTEIDVDGQSLTITSLDSGTIEFKTSDGEGVSHSLSSLSPDNQKLVMELTGWGRVWEDSTGTHRRIADLAEIKDNTVILEKIGGTKIEVPIDRLSKIDRLYIEARRNPQTGPLPDEFVAKVVGLSDGDTVTVLLSRRQYKIRLSGIDTPEIGQDFGSKAKKHLGDLVHGKFVSGVREETDKYGRNVCTLTIDGERVDYNMLRNGLAWHYVKYSSDPKRGEFETEAKDSKLNIWREAGPVPPWEWRKWGSAKRKKWLSDKNGDIAKSRGPPTQTEVPSVANSLTSSKGERPTTPAKETPAIGGYWLTSSSKVRHNSSCRWYEKSKGHHCSSTDGRACKKCGG